VIRLATPSIDESDLSAVARVLESGHLVQGPEVTEFEAELAEIIGTRHVVAVNSGTSALLATLHALGVGPGSLVPVAAYSWIATANVVSLLGGDPLFIDIDPETHAMDPDQLESALDGLSGDELISRVPCVVPVHPFGYVADMDRINEIANRHGIPVVEDAACALGARLDGRPAGSWGLAGCFSFHPRKIITTGEGGAVATDDDRLAEHIREFRNHGQSVRTSERAFVMPGDNLRMTDFQAALGRSQLRRLDELLNSRRAAMARYVERLERTGFVPQRFDWDRTAGQSFVVTVSNTRLRDDIIAGLSEFGVEAGIGTIDMPGAEHYASARSGGHHPCPVTRDIAARSMSLPLHHGMDAEMVDEVVATLQRVISRTGDQVEA
jgi:perosamine synthetase